MANWCGRFSSSPAPGAAAALRRFIGYFRQRPESAGRQHHVTNLIITPTAAGASGKSYVAVALRMGDGPHRLHVLGYYEDELVREAGRWCFARRCIRDWSGPVLARIAGQDGLRAVRPLPAPPRSCGRRDPAEAAALVLAVRRTKWNHQDMSKTPAVRGIADTIIPTLLAGSLLLASGCGSSSSAQPASRR